MKILIGADLVPTPSNAERFCKGDAEGLVGRQLKMLLDSADYRVFNLEVPLTDLTSPIKKYGPALIAPAAAVVGYKALGVNLLTLANNHILDQGVSGLESTLEALNKEKIHYLGVGKNQQEAASPFILELEGKKIGIYACANHEFSIVSEERPGANPMDPLESPDHIAALKQSCDYVIVLYHSGKEHYRYPSPDLQRVCRKLVEKGADLILCQHSHCIGCKEEYLGGTIVYGQGNFLFDDYENECWNTGLLVQLEDEFQISFIPVCKNDNAVRLAEGEESAAILDAFAQRSKEILEPGFVRQNYSQLADSVFLNNLAAFSGVRRNVIIRILNKLTRYKFTPWLMKRKYGEKELLVIQNRIECEAHSEALLCGLKNRLK